uniref:Uncharacterized protein n=1 Tax=Vespula pensylvanica TaxID=30213 RepID=A0A834UF90_VESPE|nr:hypothetical protein H0235_004040 [Vespula pensylvanica]
MLAEEKKGSPLVRSKDDQKTTMTRRYLSVDGHHATAAAAAATASAAAATAAAAFLYYEHGFFFGWVASGLPISVSIDKNYETSRRRGENESRGVEDRRWLRFEMN